MLEVANCIQAKDLQQSTLINQQCRHPLSILSIYFQPSTDLCGSNPSFSLRLLTPRHWSQRPDPQNTSRMHCLAKNKTFGWVKIKIMNVRLVTKASSNVILDGNIRKASARNQVQFVEVHPKNRTLTIQRARTEGWFPLTRSHKHHHSLHPNTRRLEMFTLWHDTWQWLKGYFSHPFVGVWKSQCQRASAHKQACWIACASSDCTLQTPLSWMQQKPLACTLSLCLLSQCFWNNF